MTCESQQNCSCESNALRPQHSALGGRSWISPSQQINLGFTGIIPSPQHSTHGKSAKNSLGGCCGMLADISCWCKICLMLSILSLQHFSMVVLYALSPQHSALSGLGWSYSWRNDSNNSLFLPSFNDVFRCGSKRIILKMILSHSGRLTYQMKCHVTILHLQHYFNM